MVQNMRRDVESNITSLINKQKNYQSELTENTIKLKLIAEDFEKYNLKDDVKDLEEATLESICFNQKIQNFTSSFQTVMANYTYSEKPSDFDRLIHREMENTESSSNFIPENHEIYTSFKEAIWNVHNSGIPMPGHEDDEFTMTTKFSTKSNLQCPLTMKSITELNDPVCCSECRHVYEKESVIAYIASKKGNQRCRCPIPGCSKFLSNKNILFDVKLKMEIMELKSKMQDTNSENVMSLE